MKTQNILTLYDTLLCGAMVEKKSFCTQKGISERTFYRYIREINIFIMHCKRDVVLRVDDPYGLYYIAKF